MIFFNPNPTVHKGEDRKKEEKERGAQAVITTLL
jgi:hypothetical protein